MSLPTLITLLALLVVLICDLILIRQRRREREAYNERLREAAMKWPVHAGRVAPPEKPIDPCPEFKARGRS